MEVESIRMINVQYLWYSKPVGGKRRLKIWIMYNVYTLLYSRIGRYTVYE